MNPLSLSELNRLVAGVIKETFFDTYWLTAETSDVRENANGHCYLEFIEKNEKIGSITAKARAYIWNNTFRILKPYFEQATKQAFGSGLKIMVRVGIDFHELYGYGLVVYDIDPTYTLGDLQRRKQAIIRQLGEEGTLTMNKELDFPEIPQRIAVISSATAAGYEDFLEHLHSNPTNFVFYPKLFPAVMQGEQTESSVINALNKIFHYKDDFDVVIIIRGGGAASDLSSFDSYELANNCAQFPLPIITGIGHERDDTILDVVSYKRVKTPTAVADFLIEKISETYNNLLDIRHEIITQTIRMLNIKHLKLQNMVTKIPNSVNLLTEKQSTNLKLYKIRLENETKKRLNQKKNKLNEIESFLKLSSPEFILEKGYSITTKNGKVVKNIAELELGDVVITKLYSGEFSSVVTF